MVILAESNIEINPATSLLSSENYPLHVTLVNVAEALRIPKNELIFPSPSPDDDVNFIFIVTLIIV